VTIPIKHKQLWHDTQLYNWA